MINTSFNEGGKPLLNHASTAIKMLKSTNMAVAWLNGVMYAKPS